MATATPRPDRGFRSPPAAWRVIGVFAAFLIAAIGCRSAHSGVQGPVDGANATVIDVVDGDTVIVVFTGSASSRTHAPIRLLGIDTPESVDPNRPVQCFGVEASRRLAELIPPGTRLRLVLDTEPTDHYDRVLAYAFRATDGLFVNLDLIETGHADVLSIEPNTHYAEAFAAARARARTAERGLWGICGGADVALDPDPDQQVRRRSPEAIPSAE